ncbi:MAG TPA: hypothetical protein DCE41_08460 [Cytophagales bacterium]|nr:hypothetical protein [Cytophagales bacterium]HAA19847.1 hypothetical protein [Cytophagales bacterium]HAP61202.1 hypothetical protein [Cytophagales bacterium]
MDVDGSFNIFINDEEACDLLEIERWYSGKGGQAFESFLRAYKEALERLALFPKAYQKIYLEFRKAPIKRFPYAIIYEVHTHLKEVEIMAIFHTHRNPYQLEQRLTNGDND